LVKRERIEDSARLPAFPGFGGYGPKESWVYLTKEQALNLRPINGA
jgi:hypothetical protein